MATHVTTADAIRKRRHKASAKPHCQRLMVTSSDSRDSKSTVYAAFLQESNAKVPPNADMRKPNE